MKKRPKIGLIDLFWGVFGGANERTRTADLLITSELLYQLSYIGLAWGTLSPPFTPGQA